MNWLPWSLIAFRLGMGPLLLLDARDGATGWAFIAGLGVAILSDILDGIMARRAGSATVRLRRLDSLVDSIFFLFVAAAAGVAHGGVLLAHGTLVAAMLALWLLSQLPALIKFGQAAAYHAYSAKAAGLALLAAGVRLFGTGQGGWLLDAALWVAIFSHLDRIAITLLLPGWRTDVSWVGAAWTERQNSAKAS